MANLFLGLHIIFPIFFVIAIGYVLRRMGKTDENFISKSTFLIFYVALPAKLFFSVKNSTVDGLDWGYTAYILLGTAGVFALALLFGRLFIKDNKKMTAFVHCAYRSNFLYVGLPVLEQVYQGETIGSVLVMLVFGLTFFNILAIILLTYYGEATFRFSKFIVKIVKNPMIIAIVLGLIAKMVHLPVYGGIEEAAGILARLCIPLSLVLIGGSLNFRMNFSDFRIILGSILIKDVVGVSLLVPIGYLLGFGESQLIVAYIIFGTPCALNCFIMGKQMGSDDSLTSQIITASFVLAIFSYAIGIAVLQSIGLLPVLI